MTDRVKIYEEKTKSGLPLLAWLLPLLLLLALLAWFLLHRQANPADTASTAAVPAASTAAGVTSPAAMPTLGEVHFATDQATLTPEGEATLQRAADYMKQNPQIHLRLEGFTDSTGTDPHNQSLSDRRAATAAQFLKAQGIDGSRLTGQGFAAANPADSNATSSGKADNRRVELFSQQ